MTRSFSIGSVARGVSAAVTGRTSGRSITCIANRFCDLMPLWRYQQLLPHFGEAGTAILAVEVIE